MPRVHILPPVPPRHRPPFAVSVTQAIVAHTFGVRSEALRAPTRHSARAAHARQVAMYLSHVVLRLSLGEVGRAFGRDPSTVSHACHRIEDLRDDPATDLTLNWLESFVRSAAGEGA